LNGDRYSGVAVARRFALTLRNDKRRRNPQSLSKKYGDVIATDQSLVATLERRDSKALDQLIPLVHGELRRMARRYMGQQPAGPHTPDDSADPRGLCAPGRAGGDRWENRDHSLASHTSRLRP